MYTQGVKNTFSLQDSQALLYVRDGPETVAVILDPEDLAVAARLRGTWTISGGYVTGKVWQPLDRALHTVLLHRWVTEAGGDEEVTLLTGPLDLRRAHLVKRPKREAVLPEAEKRWMASAERDTDRRRRVFELALSRRVAKSHDIAVDVAWSAVHGQKGGRRILAAVARERETMRLERTDFVLPNVRRLRHRWHRNIPDIRLRVETLDPGWFVDRAAIETLFGLGRVAAVQLLARLGARLIGSALAIDRETLLERLESLERDPELVWETDRRRRVATLLDVEKKLLPGRQVQIRISPEVLEASSSIAGLPQTIRLAEGRLEINFFGAEDLLHQLVELGTAMTRDFARFQQIVEGVSGQVPTDCI